MKQLMSFDPGEWTESLRKEYVMVIEGFFTLPFPMFSATYRRAIRARTKVAEALTLIVRERRKEGGARSDMLGALMASGDQFCDEQIVDFMIALLVAGYETTSTLMTLAVKFLTETPLALAQLKVNIVQILLLINSWKSLLVTLPLHFSTQLENLVTSSWILCSHLCVYK